jgi:hypothetical protein
MPICPYPENITDEVSGQTKTNILYMVWHEGFEAHKFEMSNQLRKLASLAQMLDKQIVKVNELQTELEEQKTKYQNKS